jgi:hypothetical protein
VGVATLSNPDYLSEVDVIAIIDDTVECPCVGLNEQRGTPARCWCTQRRGVIRRFAQARGGHPCPPARRMRRAPFGRSTTLRRSQGGCERMWQYSSAICDRKSQRTESGRRVGPARLTRRCRARVWVSSMPANASVWIHWLDRSEPGTVKRRGRTAGQTENTNSLRPSSAAASRQGRLPLAESQ